MNYLKYAVIILLSVTAFIILIFCLLSKKPIKTLLFNVFLGVCSLAIINLTSKFSGAYIPINQFTVVGSGVFGMPAICGFLILNLIFV